MYREGNDSVLERLTENDIVEIEYFDNSIPDEKEFDTREDIEAFLKDNSGKPDSVVGYVYSDIDKDDRYITLYQSVIDDFNRRPVKILINSIFEIRILS